MIVKAGFRNTGFFDDLVYSRQVIALLMKQSRSGLNDVLPNRDFLRFHFYKRNRFRSSRQVCLHVLYERRSVDPALRFFGGPVVSVLARKAISRKCELRNRWNRWLFNLVSLDVHNSSGDR